MHRYIYPRPKSTFLLWQHARFFFFFSFKRTRCRCRCRCVSALIVARMNGPCPCPCPVPVPNPVPCPGPGPGNSSSQSHGHGAVAEGEGEQRNATRRTAAKQTVDHVWRRLPVNARRSRGESRRVDHRSSKRALSRGLWLLVVITGCLLDMRQQQQRVE